MSSVLGMGVGDTVVANGNTEVLVYNAHWDVQAAFPYGFAESVGDAIAGQLVVDWLPISVDRSE